MSKRIAAVALVLLAPFLLIGGGAALVFVMLLGDLGGGETVSAECGSSAVTPGEVGTEMSVAGYSGEQLENAAEIMRAGADLGLSAHGQTVGVMTAMGESTLRVIDYGDEAGPDSRGLFQQRDNGAWGSYQDRMDPYISATNFFEALVRVPTWESLEPTLAAHQTQRNRDPYHYTDYWKPAVEVVAALSDDSTDLDAELGVSAPAPCAPIFSGTVGESGWVHPIPDFTTFWNNYGADRGSYSHAGEDFAAPSGHPILSVTDGTVSHTSCQSWQGRSPCNVVIDHGRDDQGRLIQTVYVHMFPEQVYVQEGQDVTAGEVIGGVGNNGNSTGYHLHFEVWVDGSDVDPEAFLAGVGVDLGDPSATELVNAPAQA